MAHSAQARKRIRQNEKRRLLNKSKKSEIKTLTKRLTDFVEGREVEAARALLPKLISRLDKAVKSNLFHKNTVARKKSKVTTLVGGLEGQGGELES